jgi:hypothetical protein
MRATERIFLDFNLPNATTWFYFSFLLAISLFFKFGRVLSVRNWDVLTVFLLVPGLMIIESARPGPVTTPHHPALKVARLVGEGSGGMLPAGLSTLGAVAEVAQAHDPALAPIRWMWLGYLWLMIGSAYLFCRCIYDLALVQRPALAPNLSFGGLAFLAIALLSCLMAVAFRPSEREPFAPPKVDSVSGSNKPAGSQSVFIALAREQSERNWWRERGGAVACHLAVVLGLVLVGRRHFLDPTAGMAAATLYLMLPYTGMYVGQLQHVLPMALVVWALVVFPWPMLAGFLFGLAAGSTYFPALLLPIWLGFYWRRGAGRFFIALVFAVAFTLALAALGLLLEMEKRGQEMDLEQVWYESVGNLLKNPNWQPWKIPDAEGFWTGVVAAYRLPVFVAFVVFILATALWPAPKNLAHVLALSAGVIIALQLWYGDQGGVYVLWYLPLLVLLVFRPNLSERRPPELHPDTDFLTRLRRNLFRLITRNSPPTTPAPSPAGAPQGSKERPAA